MKYLLLFFCILGFLSCSRIKDVHRYRKRVKFEHSLLCSELNSNFSTFVLICVQNQGDAKHIFTNISKLERAIACEFGLRLFEEPNYQKCLKSQRLSLTDTMALQWVDFDPFEIDSLISEKNVTAFDSMIIQIKEKGRWYRFFEEQQDLLKCAFYLYQKGITTGVNIDHGPHILYEYYESEEQYKQDRK